METIVPVISSGTAGPLGVLHLPRLWLKCLLGSVGRLPEGYKDCGAGYDHMVLEALGIKPADARAFIHENKPSYLAFEAWVKSYPGVKLDTATIFRSNTDVASYIHSDEARKAILAESGLPDDGSTSPGAIDLNNLDDWQTAHAALTAK